MVIQKCLSEKLAVQFSGLILVRGGSKVGIHRPTLTTWGYGGNPANFKYFNMFQVGNRVKVVGEPANHVYEVIGNKQHPYDGRLASPFNQPIEVPRGCDYILKRVIPEISHEEGFVPFLFVPEFRLVHWS